MGAAIVPASYLVQEIAHQFWRCKMAIFFFFFFSLESSETDSSIYIITEGTIMIALTISPIKQIEMESDRAC